MTMFKRWCVALLAALVSVAAAAQVQNPEVAARLMRTLVAKHRALYTQHLDGTLGYLFAEKASVSHLLDRIYSLPGARSFLKVREFLRQARLL